MSNSSNYTKDVVVFFDGIYKTKILAAYDIIENDENFDWKDLDVIYMEWEELIDEANQILNEL